MKKLYVAPDAEVIKFKLKDVLSGSPTDVVSSDENDDTNLSGLPTEFDPFGL